MTSKHRKEPEMTVEYARRFSIVLSVAELGAMKDIVDSLPFCKNKTERNKKARPLVTMLLQLNKVRGDASPKPYAELVSYETFYSMEDDDLSYTFTLQYHTVKPVKSNKVEDEDVPF